MTAQIVAYPLITQKLPRSTHKIKPIPSGYDMIVTK